MKILIKSCVSLKFELKNKHVDFSNFSYANTIFQLLFTPAIFHNMPCANTPENELVH